jgi:hypothetical protein
VVELKSIMSDYFDEVVKGPEKQKSRAMLKSDFVAMRDGKDNDPPRGQILEFPTGKIRGGRDI